jgi:DNA-binding XRE family transcriptional regulator
MKLRNDLKVAIIRAGKTQKMVAEEVGITEAYLSRIVTGRKKNLSMVLALKICKAINRKSDDVFWIEEPPD